MALLSDLADLRARVAASPGRLEKRRLVAEYLRSLSPDDLTRAVTYLSGRAFPASDPRVLNVRGLPVATSRETSASALTLEDVRAHFAAAGVPPQKTPESLHVVDDLPRTAAGKVLKSELRAWLR